MASSIRVGIVDVDGGIREGRRLVLDSAPDISVVFEADNAADVLARFDDYLLDVLLVEQRLRAMTGVELVSKLSAIKIASANKTRILLTTIFNSDELTLAALEAGASSVVSQDAGPARLLDEIRLLSSAKPAHTKSELKSLIQTSPSADREDLALKVYLDSIDEPEQAVLARLVDGDSGSQIATDLSVAVYRVRKLLETALSNLGLATIEQFQLRCIRAGVLDA